MARNRVNPRARETEAERQLADDIADNGPSVESIAVTVPPSENPYDPARSIDASPGPDDETFGSERYRPEASIDANTDPA